MHVGERRGAGNSLIKVGTDVRGRALGILGVNFCPGSRFWQVNFAQALGFWQFLKKCVIFDKSEKSDLNLMKIPVLAL